METLGSIAGMLFLITLIVLALWIAYSKSSNR